MTSSFGVGGSDAMMTIDDRGGGSSEIMTIVDMRIFSRNCNILIF